MKNFTRRRGTAVAAAALSLALVAPLTQPVAGAEDAANAEGAVTAISATQQADAATNLKVAPGTVVTFADVKLAELEAGTQVTVTFKAKEGEAETTATVMDVNGTKVLKFKVPANAVSGNAVVKVGENKIEIPLEVEDAPAATTTTTATTSATMSSTTSVAESTTSEVTPPASSDPASTTSTPNGSSIITDSQKCRNAVLGWGIPLAVLVPVGLLANAAVPGLRALSQAAGDVIREANAQFQNQIGVMNPELAALQADFNDQLRQFNTDISQLAFGAAFLGLGIGALAHLGTACSPAATVIPTKPVTETKKTEITLPQSSGSSIGGKKTSTVTTTSTTTSAASSSEPSKAV